jgi:hypothetical protein|tara:strand:+ start:91 stop:264 length:174 start_codon:yes stop_codon:yes gene_type:complete
MTALVPGMTTTDTTNSEPGTFEGTVFLYCFFGVVRTSGIKTALIANQQTKRMLIKNY